MQFRISIIFLPYFRKSKHRNVLFLLFVRPESKVFLFHLKTQHDQRKPSSFYFTCADYIQAVLLSSWVFFLREKFVLVVVVVFFVICSVFVCFSAFESILHNISWNKHQNCYVVTNNNNFAEISASRKNAANVRIPQN